MSGCNQISRKKKRTPLIILVFLYYRHKIHDGQLKKSIKTDAAQPKILYFFYSIHSTSLSKPAAYITHNATHTLAVQSEIWMCSASRSWCKVHLKQSRQARCRELVSFFLTTHRHFFSHFTKLPLEPQKASHNLTSMCKNLCHFDVVSIIWWKTLFVSKGNTDTPSFLLLFKDAPAADKVAMQKYFWKFWVKRRGTFSTFEWS